jgi:signal transduction histidine kinase
MNAAPSLRKRLFWRLLGVQSCVLIAVVGVLFASGLLVDLSTTDSTIETLRRAVVRDTDGRLGLAASADLETLRKAAPDLWFVIRDRKGDRITEGDVPFEYADLGAALDHVGQARLGWNIGDPERPVARMRWADSAAGRLQFVTGTDSPMSPLLVVYAIALVVLKEALPILGVIALGAFVATPLVLRRSLAGVEQAARQADAIDVEQRGARLDADVPREILPLVRAMNGALDRLDQGYERQQRFLADAAHELRTPLAILSARLGSLPASPLQSKLSGDAARMGVIIEQMLDLQRLRSEDEHFAPIDLERLAHQVILDIGPLAFAAGYRLDFSAAGVRVDVQGDRRAIERALTNLVQNAIDHGGGQGTIAIRLGAGWIEVADEGPGIPKALRSRIFEAFYKGHKEGRGAGLGLSLVDEVMRLHGGIVSVEDSVRGACFRLSFPVPLADLT